MIHWEDVKPFFDVEINGVLPDVIVEDTDVSDWQALLDLIRSQPWQHTYLCDDVPTRLPTAADLIAKGADDADLRVWPVPGVLVIFRPFGAKAIDFDVDLRELQGQERLNVLVDFLHTIGRHLHKPVTMTFEGSARDPILGYDPTAGEVIVLADLQNFSYE
ncbi:hypothetical protein ACIBHX_42455 [Nonomuraea sp. NPDC050536]|uniref:hypothetical protein n=1 Tax=Nonomuraea sp. NPDC050536 TaxID=3364366 RepID=UPI0037C69DFC